MSCNLRLASALASAAIADFELCLRALYRRLIGILLDHEGDAVRCHEAALGEVHLVEKAFDAGRQRNLLRCDHRTDEFGLRRDRRELHRGRLDDRRCRRCRLLCDRALPGKQKQPCDEKAATSD